MSVIIPIKPLIPGADKYSLDIRAAIAGIGERMVNPVVLTRILTQIQDSSNRIEKAIRLNTTNTFQEILVKDASGAVIGWIGTRGGYSGAWFKQLYVGADGPDTAPFFADVDGNVIIGKNGSLALQDGGGNEVGWLGVQTDSAQTVTGATNATPIEMTVAAHGYEDGDTVFIANVGGNTAANGYRIVQAATTNTFEITDLAGVDVAGTGAYTTGGTSTRYFGGGRFQTLAIGNSFTDYKLRAYADGQVHIKDALITLTDVANNGYIELNPSNGPDSIFRDTFTGQQIRIQAGILYGNNQSGTGLTSEFSRDGLVVRNSSGNANVGVFSTGGEGAVYVRTNSGTAKARLVSSGGAGSLALDNAGGSNTIGLNGSTGSISGESVSAAASYSIGGTPGVSDSQNIVESIIVSTGSAVDSVDFTLETTTSISVVTGLSITTVSRDWTSGLLTT